MAVCPWVSALLVAFAPASAEEQSVFPKPVCVRFGPLGWEFVVDDDAVAWNVAREESGWIAVGKSPARWSPRAHVFAPQEADAWYSAVLVRSPDDFLARQRRAAARMKLGDHKGGIADYRQLMETGRADATVYLALGGYLGEQGDRAQACDVLSQGIAAFPDEPLAYVLRARFAAQDGNSRSARADLQRASDLGAKDQATLMMVAAASMEQDQHELAVAALTRLIDMAPEEGHLYEMRAIAKFALGRPDEVAQDVERALERGGNRPKLWKLRGAHSLSNSRWDAAAEDFSRILELDPRDEEARRIRALAYVRANRNDEAIQDFDALLEKNPHDVALLEYRSRVYATKAEWEHAVADLEEAARLEPQQPFAPAQLAWWQATCATDSVRDDRTALQNALLACKLTDWKQPRALFVLAAAFAESGNFEAASSWQSKANSLANEDELKDFGNDVLQRYQSKRPYRAGGLVEDPMAGLWEELRHHATMQLKFSVKGPW